MGTRYTVYGTVYSFLITFYMIFTDDHLGQPNFRRNESSRSNSLKTIKSAELCQPTDMITLVTRPHQSTRSYYNNFLPAGGRFTKRQRYYVLHSIATAAHQ